MELFKAIVVRKTNDEVTYKLEDVSLSDLSAGEVVIEVAYSSVNFKDMLAVQANGGVVRDYPMIPGIDLSGTIVHSTDERFFEGQAVLVTGFDTGVRHTGGFAQYARIPADWIMPIPDGLTLKDAMVFGTAGFTAALSIMALEKHGMSVGSSPQIVVTGSTGGVGSVALQILSKIGYTNITAVVRKEHQVDVAKALGATEVIFAADIGDSQKSLNKAQYHYVLDTVGGQVAAALIPQIHYGGSMTMCGHAGGAQLATNVLPFILRGINLLGIDSVNVPIEKRAPIWEKIAQDWNISATTLAREIPLEEVPETIEAVKNGQHLGRTIIKMR